MYKRQEFDSVYSDAEELIKLLTSSIKTIKEKMLQSKHNPVSYTHLLRGEAAEQARIEEEARNKMVNIEMVTNGDVMRSYYCKMCIRDRY